MVRPHLGPATSRGFLGSDRMAVWLLVSLATLAIGYVLRQLGSRRSEPVTARRAPGRSGAAGRIAGLVTFRDGPSEDDQVGTGAGARGPKGRT